MYAPHLYFLGLSFRSTVKALDPFLEKRSLVAVWNWVQLINPNKFYLKRSRVTAFTIDETMLQIRPDYAWLWIAIESVHGSRSFYLKTQESASCRIIPENIDQGLW
jgi:putative transposase